MRLSEYANSLFSDFFSDSEICESGRFPKVEVYARRGSWLVTNLLMVDGITIGRFVFINPKLVKRDQDRLLRISQTLMAHELAHVLQYQREGFFPFLIGYVKSFWEIFRKKERWNFRSWYESYFEMPQEVEAREIAAEFSKWIEQRSRD